MEDSFAERVRKAADDVTNRLDDLAQQTGEKIDELREGGRLAGRIRELEREKDGCRRTIADLVVRMFDQQAFVENLLRPEYLRIKEIDAEIARLQAARENLGRGPDGDAPAAGGAC